MLKLPESDNIPEIFLIFVQVLKVLCGNCAMSLSSHLAELHIPETSDKSTEDSLNNPSGITVLPQTLVPENIEEILYTLVIPLNSIGGYVTPFSIVTPPLTFLHLYGNNILNDENIDDMLTTFDIGSNINSGIVPLSP